MRATSTPWVTPNGRAVSGSTDGTPRLWGLESGEEIAAFTGYGEICCCAFTRDGPTIVAGAVVYGLSPDDLAYAKLAAGREKGIDFVRIMIQHGIVLPIAVGRLIGSC